MAQIIPPITSLPIDSSAAPSVEDIQDRLPSICVDYLSHDWSEEDVWASWRNMTRHKHEIANGVRLENASWRTWQKQRNKLKTISPETLNWLKDSDVTWLYGPLHTAHVEPVRPLKVAGADERLGIETGSVTAPTSARPFKKPILKHRTLSEMLTIPIPASPILEATPDDDMDDFEGDDRPPLLKTKSDTNIIRARTATVRRKSPPRGPISSGKHTPMEGEPMSPHTENTGSGKRHISFNTFVEQCVAVDDPSDVLRIDEDSEDEMLEMRSSSSSRSSRPSMSRSASSTSTHGAELLTIAMIAPTILKTPGVINVGSLPNMVYAPPPEYLSPNAAQAAQTYDFPSPVVQTATRWQSGIATDEEDDEYGSVGYDYFVGPDLSGAGDSADKRRGSAPQPQQVTTHMGQSYGRAPTVAPPPAQPKWRQAQPESLDSSASHSNSSSNSSLRDQVVSPQQTKGILKVRAPGATPPEPSSPPGPSYFNYNPSQATGIGGMPNGTRYLNHSATSPPVTSPSGSVGGEERGRSTSRDRSSSADNRSSSRGTSTASTSSISPGASRSPVGAARRSNQPPMQPPVATQLDRLQEGQMWNGPETDQAADRASTPTPHSSPQIAFRPLKDTSPASLPHTSSRFDDSVSSIDTPSTVSPPSSANSSASKATIAHVSTNAAPTLSQAGPGAQGQTKAQAQLNGATAAKGGGFGASGMDDEDGSSIMGRAANIANTAKDLLGALWYGANEQQGAGGKKAGGHRRGQSLG